MLRIVVLVKGENEGKVTIASTASEYPLAIFALGNPPLNPKNALLSIPNPDTKRGEIPRWQTENGIYR